MGVLNTDKTEAEAGVADAPAAADETAAGLGNAVAVAGEAAAGGEPAAAEPEAEQPRDERRDSIDPATGQLTAEALAIRAAERQA